MHSELLIQVGGGHAISAGLLGCVAVLVFVVLFAFDYWLVSTGRKSISITAWLAEKAHPTLIVGVMLLGLLLFWLTLYAWPVAFAIAVAIGHMVTTEGAASALVSASRWKGDS